MIGKADLHRGGAEARRRAGERITWKDANGSNKAQRVAHTSSEEADKCAHSQARFIRGVSTKTYRAGPLIYEILNRPLPKDFLILRIQTHSNERSVGTRLARLN